MSLVKAGYYGYTVIDHASGNSGSGSSLDREFFLKGHHLRLREYGTLKKIRFYCRYISNTTLFTFSVWRGSTGDWDRIGTTENIVASVVGDSINEITFTNPITGIEPGDIIGYRLAANVSEHQVFAVADANVVMYYHIGSPGDTAVNWEGETNIGNWIIYLEPYMDNPTLVGIGDSVMAGHPAHYSYCETTDTNDPDSHIMYHLYSLTGMNYQNMGIGSEQIADIKARFATDVIAIEPDIAILQGGGNDYGAVVPPTKQDWLDDYEDNITACLAAGMKVVVLLMTPWDGGTTLQMQTRDDWNLALTALAESYGAMVIDPNPTVGLFRAGGDAGNLWDMQAAYDSGDGVHFNSAGHLAIAQLLANAVGYTYTSFPYPPYFPTVHEDLPIGPDLYSVITDYINSLAAAASAMFSEGNIVLDSDQGIYFNDILQISLSGDEILFADLDVQTAFAADTGTITALTAPNLHQDTDALNILVNTAITIGTLITDRISRTAHTLTAKAEPANPAEDYAVIWLSNGTGYGNNRDLCVKVTEGAATNSFTLSAYSDPIYLQGARGIHIYTISGTEHAIIAASGNDAVALIDISTPAIPVSISAIAGAGAPNYLGGVTDVFGYTVVATEYVFAVSPDDDALTVVDVSTPAVPVLSDVETGSGENLNYAYTIECVTEGGTESALVGSNDSETGAWISRWDISAPAAIVRVSNNMYSRCCDLSIFTVGGNIYVFGVNSSGYLLTLRLGSPTGYASTQFAELDGASGIDCITIGGTEYAVVVCQESENIAILDISSPYVPTLLDSLSLGKGRKVVTATIGAVEYAFVTMNEDKAVKSVDLSTPATLALADTLTSAEYLDGAWGIDYAVIGGTEYVVATAEISNAMVIIDVSTPTAMSKLTQLQDL